MKNASTRAAARLIRVTGLVLAFATSGVMATPILDIVPNPDRTGMTHFAPFVSDPAFPSMATVNGVVISFADGTSMPGLDPVTGASWFTVAQTDPEDGTTFHEVVYTTTWPASDTITIDFTSWLPDVEVFGFAFNVGADHEALVNIEADVTGPGGTTTLTEDWFRVGPTSGAPSYGVFGDASSCTVISEVRVDPFVLTWGIGNMAIRTGPCGTASVPAPDVTALIGLGFLAMLALRRRVHARGRRA